MQHSFLMYLSLVTGLFAASVYGSTLPSHVRRAPVDLTNDLLVQDSFIGVDPSTQKLSAFVQSFVSLRGIPVAPVVDAITAVLKGAGIDVDGNMAKRVGDRARLFTAIGIGGKDYEFKINGCAKTIKTGKTSSSGILREPRSLASANCNIDSLLSQSEISTTVTFDTFLDDRKPLTTTFYPSSPQGFGILSDIDETVKISHAEDTIAALKATFIDDPEVVPGMPELYKGLTEKLGNPLVVYLTGSPFQLYPFLNGFIRDNYPRGTIMLKNLTLTDFSTIGDFLKDDGTEKYKLERIDRLHDFFPQKSFVAIGDSTARDPEVYAQSFRKYGDFIKCIWIRKVPGFKNDDQRFATAFQGIPQGKWRTFDNPQEMADVDVANGSC